MYSYTAAGLPTVKRVQVSQPETYQQYNGTTQTQTVTANLDTTLTYDSTGRLASIAYPGSNSTSSSGVTTGTGPTYNYSYDAMSRLSGMTDASSSTIVSGVSYDAANHLLGMTFNGTTETRSYNVLGQLTGLNEGGSNLTYNYPTGTNNGKLSSMYNAVSGETVTYTYDSLNRLLTATGATGGTTTWGQQYGFDPFGNLLSKTVTAGSGPSLSQAVDQTTNRIVGQTYDANGNQYSTTGSSNLQYDVENRVTSASVGAQFQTYAYDAQNRRMFNWQTSNQDSNYNMTNYQIVIYSPGGQKLATYTITPSVYWNATVYNDMPYLQVSLSSSEQHFGGRRLAGMDQLGSAGTYYPWGETKGTTNPQDNWSYATYWRDSVSGLDYAQNRYYSNAWGRFMTVDPSGAGRASKPQSWNRYQYALGDPINHSDPTGLDPDCGGGSLVVDANGTSMNVNACPIPVDPSWVFLIGSGDPTAGWIQAWGADMRAALLASYQASQASQGPNIITNLSTTSSKALDVQNDLRWLEQAITQDSDCSGWLKDSSTSIDYMLNNNLVGVGDFSNATANAQAGTTGTNLPAGSMLITINLQGAFFNSSASPGYGLPSWIKSGSAAEQGLLLLHELAHNVGAAGFIEGDQSADDQTKNNQSVLTHCGSIINNLGGR